MEAMSLAFDDMGEELFSSEEPQAMLVSVGFVPVTLGIVFLLLYMHFRGLSESLMVRGGSCEKRFLRVQ